MKKKVFLYVGHANWGKSEVLRNITDDNSRKKIINIKGELFRVRKMSNDDDEKKLLEFVKTVAHSYYEYYIIAYCPKQEISKRAKEILDILRLSSELFFFVQKKQFLSEEEITSIEIASMKKYGQVQVLEGKMEFNLRAKKFINFISECL